MKRRPSSGSSTVVSKKTKTQDVPEDQQSLVFQNSRRSLDSLRAQTNDEKAQMNELLLYQKLHGDKAVEVQLAKESWIVIDWVYGHLPDERLGFRNVTGFAMPRLVRRILMEQANAVNSLASKDVPFAKGFETKKKKGKQSFQSLVKSVRDKKKIMSESDLKTTCKEAFLRRIKKTQDGNLKYLFQSIVSYVETANVQLGTFIDTTEDRTGYWQNNLLFTFYDFPDDSKVKQIYIKFYYTGKFYYEIYHNLGFGIDINLLMKRFVIMRKAFYDDVGNIKDALDKAIQGNRIDTRILRLSSGADLESKVLKDKINKRLQDELDALQTKEDSEQNRRRMRALKKDMQDSIGLGRLAEREQIQRELLGDDYLSDVSDSDSSDSSNPDLGTSSNPIELDLQRLKF